MNIKKRKIFFFTVTLLIIMVAFSPFFASGESEAADQKQDKTLQVAFLMGDVIESSWNNSMMIPLLELKDQGYDFELKYIENLNMNTVETALRIFADQDSDVIIMHFAGGRDVTYKIHKEYPNIAFIGGGYGWITAEPNLGAYDTTNHEAIYLCGIIAGMMTKTNTIGCIGSFPKSNIIGKFNAYLRGAQAVNPDIKLLVSYINANFDPVRAQDATLALIAAGADYIYAERDGVFNACEKKGVYAFGDRIDQHLVSPSVVVTSAEVDWTPMLKEVFDRVSAGTFEARYYTPYEGNLAKGISRLSPYYDFESKIPDDVKLKVEETKAKIISGELVIPYEVIEQW
ncbi:MAG: BMP family protein [Bacteroidetes bacterium]|nr:BMP family protein [Bacteroidota bacterium]